MSAIFIMILFEQETTFRLHDVDGRCFITWHMAIPDDRFQDRSFMELDRRV